MFQVSELNWKMQFCNSYRTETINVADVTDFWLAN